MQIANIILDLGGDSRNSIPMYAVTAAEAAVLRVIHGDQSVHDIDITGTVARTHRQEIGRLTEKYSRQQADGRLGAPAVASLFPGAAARVFETYNELELPEDAFVARERKTSRDPLDHDSDGKKGGSLPKATGDDEWDNMTVVELRNHAEKNDIDLAGVTKKADIIEAIKLYHASAPKEAGAPVEPADADEDGVGDMNDEFAQSEKSGGNMFE